MKPKRWRRQATRQAERQKRKQESRTMILGEIQTKLRAFEFVADSAAAEYQLSPQARYLYFHCAWCAGRGLDPQSAEAQIPVGELYDLQLATKELTEHQLVYQQDGLLQAVHTRDDDGYLHLPVKLLPNPPWLPFRVK